jgi:hypothetical protein
VPASTPGGIVELDAGQDGGEDAPLPPGRVAGHVLLAAAQDRDGGRTLLTEQPRDADAERVRDPLQDEDGRHLGAALHLRDHAAADPGPLGEGLEGDPALGALGPDPGAQDGYVGLGRRGHGCHYSDSSFAMENDLGPCDEFRAPSRS